MSIVMFTIMSRSVNKAYFWGKQLQVFNIIILHQFDVVHLLFFVGYIIVNLIHIYFGLLCNKIVAPKG